jgi:hypothetical protein
LSGAESCGSFGSLKINPWLTTGLDAMVLGLLVFWKPDQAGGCRGPFRAKGCIPISNGNLQEDVSNVWHRLWLRSQTVRLCAVRRGLIFLPSI